MESAEVVEEKSVGAENPVENIPAETTKEQLAATPGIQPHDSPLTQTTDVGDKKDEVVSEVALTEADLLSTPTEEENAVTQKATPEQSLTTTPGTTVSQQPDLVSARTNSGNALDAEAPASKKPTLAPPSVEPVDITQSILAEAETRKNAAEDVPQKTSVAALPPKLAPTVAPDTSTKGRSAPTKANSQTMRYLVVPERIAVQVDQAFTMPQQVTPPARPAKAAPPSKAIMFSHCQRQQRHERDRRNRLFFKIVRHQKRLLHLKPGNCRPQQEMHHARNEAQIGKVQVQVASRESNKETSKEPLLRSFFPKISAGLSAVGQEWREFRDGTETSEENPSSRQAKQNEPRQQRSASRPQQSR